jgi:hypothetical protein
VRRALAAALGLVLWATGVAARPELGLEVLLGAPWNADGDVEFLQEAERDIAVRGDWESRPFEPPLYWAVRARAGAWSVELLHDKLHLENPPEEVQSFGISHGLNFVTAQHAWSCEPLYVQAHAGLVVAHPESTVRGRTASGWSLTGPVAGAGAGARIRLAPHLSGTLEARATVARVHVPIAGGEARTTNVALHVLAGIGFR